MRGTTYSFPTPGFPLLPARRECTEKQYIVKLGYCELGRPGLGVQEAPLLLDPGWPLIKRGPDGET
jgi:hypothetical protein